MSVQYDIPLCCCFLAAGLSFCLQCTIALKTFCESFYIKMINLKLRRETNTLCYESLLHAVFGFPIIWERCAILTSWVRVCQWLHHAAKMILALKIRLFHSCVERNSETNTKNLSSMMSSTKWGWKVKTDLIQISEFENGCFLLKWFQWPFLHNKARYAVSSLCWECCFCHLCFEMWLFSSPLSLCPFKVILAIH